MSSDVPAQHAMIRAVFDRDDVHERLGEITVPAVVIHGSEDVAIEHERGAELARDLPDSSFAFVHGAGHCAPAESPDEVAREIAGFLERIGY
jgi:pimeloyl-ACP methyl ester carboxylesterase